VGFFLAGTPTPFLPMFPLIIQHILSRNRSCELRDERARRSGQPIFRLGCLIEAMAEADPPEGETMTSRQRDDESQIVAADDSMRKAAAATLTPRPAIDNIGVAFHDQVLPLRIKGGTWRGWVVSDPVSKSGFHVTAEREGRTVNGFDWWIITAMEDLVRNILRVEDYPDRNKIFEQLREQVKREWVATGTIQTWEEARKKWAPKVSRARKPYGRR
jgi:hypothetical protein